MTTSSISSDSTTVSNSRRLQLDGGDVVRRALDPLGIFGGDSMGGRGSGLFPTGSGGGGDIAERLARLSKKEKGSDSFDTSNAADGLFSAGKDSGSGSAGKTGEQIGKMIGGLIQKILPLLMMFF